MSVFAGMASSATILCEKLETISVYIFTTLPDIAVINT